MAANNRSGRRGRPKLKLGAALAALAALVGIATGVLTLRDQLFGADDEGAAVQQSVPRKTPRYDGIAGHFAEGRALLDFVDQNDRGAVYLDVGFPQLATGPAGGDNVLTRTEPFKGGTRYLISEIDVMTKCESDIPPDKINPTPADGCMGTALRLSGPETTDSETFFEHGVPRLKGFFGVDVTGDLHQGLTAINLKPLTAAQAREGVSG
jgi:hypothetical protein